MCKTYLSNAMAIIKSFSDDQIQYVKDARKDYIKVYLDNIENENQDYTTNDIKADYMSSAIEENLLTEDDFNRLWQAIIVIEAEQSNAYC